MSSSVIQCKLSRLSISEDNSDYNDSPDPHQAMYSTTLLSKYKYIALGQQKSIETNKTVDADGVDIVGGEAGDD